MTSDQMLIGQDGPWSQVRRDLNRLFGTDSSTGTNPFSNPGNANDGDDSTAATRASSVAGVAHIVQSASTEGAVNSRLTLPAAPTAGNLLAAMSARADLANGTVILKHGTLTSAAFTVHDTVTVLGGARALYYGTRVSDGSDGDLDIQQNDNMVMLWEIANYGTPSGFQRKTATEQAAAFTKSLGAFSTPGDLQLMGQIVISDHQLFTIGTGWTQDTQRGARGAIVLVAGHDAAGDTPQITGNSDTSGAWAGVAVGVTSGTPTAFDSSLVADLGAAYRSNRMTLLEATDTGNQYEIAWSSNGSAWTVITPLAWTRGGKQSYDYADISARYWRIRDTHASGAVPALSWASWTIEGFPI